MTQKLYSAALMLLVVFAPRPLLAKTDLVAKCAATKQKATGVLVAQTLACYAKATAKAAAVDSTCVTKAQSKFNTSLTKIEATGACAMPGSDINLELPAETLVDDVLTATVPTCTSVGSSCGTCGTGTCSPDESGSYDVCANGNTCTTTSCSQDSDCGPGNVCTNLVLFTLCCSPCF